MPESGTHKGKDRQGHRVAEGPVAGKPPRGRQGPGIRLRAAMGGERTDVGILAGVGTRSGV